MTLISVVGHGPSPQGAGMGALIDEHAVIRMHDRAWQDAADYGVRTDYTVIPGPWAARQAHSRFRQLFCETVKPSVAWVAFTLSPRQLVESHLGLPVLWFDFRWFVEKLKPERRGVKNIVATRGTAAALAAIELGATTLRLVGMDSVVTGLITEYAEGAGRLRYSKLGSPINMRHDYEREHVRLWEFAAERGVTIVVNDGAHAGSHAAEAAA